MRVRAKESGLSVHAIAGSHVVLLGLDLERRKTPGLLGFAIHRTDHSRARSSWMRGFKTFEATEPDPVPGHSVSTLNHPIQGFHWADYAVNPGARYTYRVVALHGDPVSLHQRASVGLDVTAEPVDRGVHAVYFNRGVAGSQAYSRTFGDRRPDQAAGAYEWLSRGLEEAILGFIGQARGRRYGLRVAAYEFSYPPVLAALAEAAGDEQDPGGGGWLVTAR